MRKLVIILLLLFSTVGMAQDWQFNGTKYPNATNVGDTVSLQTHIPIIDSQGLLNYYLPAGDLLELNTTVTWENITGDQGAVNISGFFNDAGYLTTETDPTVGSHIKAITTGDISTWNSALQTEVDPTVPSHVKSITTTNINTWNSAIQSGDNVSELNNDANYTTLATTDTRYLRSDISDDNGVNELTLGGLNLPSIPVGLSTYDHLVVNPTTGEVNRIQLGTFDFEVGDGTTTQFNVNSTTPELNFVGSGDTSISFNGTTNTVTITSIPGAGGGGAVTSFEGRDGAVVSQAGDYNTGEVNELGNLYFTEPRVRSTALTGFATGANTSITSTDNILQAFQKTQGQINNREPKFSKNTAFNKNFGTSAGTVLEGDWRPTFAQVTSKPTTLSGYGITDAYTKTVSDGRYYQLAANNTGITGVLQFQDNTSIRFGTGSEFRILHASDTHTYFQMNTEGNLIIRDTDAAINRFVFERTTGKFTAKGTGSFGNGVDLALDLQASAGARGVKFRDNANIIRGEMSWNNNQWFLRNHLDEPMLNVNWGDKLAVFSGTLSATNLSGTNTGDQTLSGLGGVPTGRVITAGTGLTGGGNLSANRTISVDYPTLDSRYVTNSGDEAIAGVKQFLETVKVGGTGITFTGTGSKGFLSDTNDKRLLLGGGSAWSGLNGAYISIEGIDYGGTGAGGNVRFSLSGGKEVYINSYRVWHEGNLLQNAGSGTVGALRYNGTTKAAGMLYGGSTNPSNTTRLNYDGNLYVNNLTSMGGMTATGNIVSDSNIQASGAIITGAGIFTGRVSGADAVNDNEFVTRRQVAPIAASGSGLARLAGANTAMVTNSSVSGYYTEGGTTFSVNIPAGTFSDNVHLGALTIDLNAALTYTGATTTGTEDYSMDIVFIQGSTVDRIPFYVTSIPRVSKLGYLTYRMTAISRSSAGIFMISGGGNQYPSGAPFMEPYTLNIDARQAFTIRIRKGSTGSDTNMDVDIASFVVTTMDGGAQ